MKKTTGMMIVFALLLLQVGYQTGTPIEITNQETTIEETQTF